MAASVSLGFYVFEVSLQSLTALSPSSSVSQLEGAMAIGPRHRVHERGCRRRHSNLSAYKYHDSVAERVILNAITSLKTVAANAILSTVLLWWGGGHLGPGPFFQLLPNQIWPPPHLLVFISVHRLDILEALASGSLGQSQNWRI